MGLLGGVGAGGAVGGITGALIGAGIPEYKAKRYESRIRKGSVLLSVHCDDALREQGKGYLENTRMQDISSTSEAKADFGATDCTHPRTTTSRI